MATPLTFEITQRTNEPFEISIPFPWDATQWPLPAGSYFQSDVRLYRQAVDIALSFDSSSNPSNLSPAPITQLWDGTTNTLQLTFFAPQSAVAAMIYGHSYVMDVRLIRPRTGMADHVDIIGDGTVILLEGITR